MNSPRADLELRVGIQPIEELHAERDKLIAENKVRAALHKPYGKWDARRKIMLALAKRRVRDGLNAGGVRLTNDEVDARAHADPVYTAWVDESIQEDGEYQVMDAKIQAINELIMRDQGLMNWSRWEPK